MRIAPLALVAVGLVLGLGIEANATRLPVPRFLTFELTIGPVANFAAMADENLAFQKFRVSEVRISGNTRSNPHELTIRFWGKDYKVPPEILNKLPPNPTGIEVSPDRYRPERGNAMLLRVTQWVFTEEVFNEGLGAARTGIIRISEKRGVELVSSNLKKASAEELHHQRAPHH